MIIIRWPPVGAALRKRTDHSHRASPLDNFRHFEEGAIRFWCVRECLFMGQRLAQALADIVAAGVSETRSTLFGFVYTVAIQGLGQGRNVRSVELVQSIDVVENRVQVAHHASP